MLRIPVLGLAEHEVLYVFVGRFPGLTERDGTMRRSTAMRKATTDRSVYIVYS